MTQATTWGVPRNAGEADLTQEAWATRADESFDAELSCQKGGTAPPYAVAGTEWMDDSATPWVKKRYDGSNWIVEGVYDPSTGQMQHRWYKGADIASASSITVTPDGNYFDITGTATIAGIGTVLPAGVRLLFQFDAALTLTHNGTSFKLDGEADLAVEAGDMCEFVSEGSGNYRMLWFKRAGGKPFAGSVLETPQSTASGSFRTFSGIPSWVTEVDVYFSGVGEDTGNSIIIRLGTASGLESTGYIGAAARQANGANSAVEAMSDGFLINNNNASYAWSGLFTIKLMDTNTWVFQGSVGQDGSGRLITSAGRKTLADTLTQISIRTSGAFDEGSVNIRYR